MWSLNALTSLKICVIKKAPNPLTSLAYRNAQVSPLFKGRFLIVPIRIKKQ